ncbi:MAG: hypothetical protein LAO22_06145 [Acidobacteriia bacterium]|nr:hypothetical protein [Terriglobia bacterium]
MAQRFSAAITGLCLVAALAAEVKIQERKGFVRSLFSRAVKSQKSGLQPCWSHFSILKSDFENGFSYCATVRSRAESASVAQNQVLIGIQTDSKFRLAKSQNPWLCVFPALWYSRRIPGAH